MEAIARREVSKTCAHILHGNRVTVSIFGLVLGYRKATELEVAFARVLHDLLGEFP